MPFQARFSVQETATGATASPQVMEVRPSGGLTGPVPPHEEPRVEYTNFTKTVISFERNNIGGKFKLQLDNIIPFNSIYQNDMKQYLF